MPEDTDSHVPLSEEEAYRNLFRDPENSGSTLEDLFAAIEENGDVRKKLEPILSKEGPLKILIEGSATKRNLDAIDRLIKGRNNPDDTVLLVDRSPVATTEHAQHLSTEFP